MTMATEFRPVRRIGKAAALVLLYVLTLAACGNLQTKNNNDKFAPYGDPTAIGSFSYTLRTDYPWNSTCESGLDNMVADALLNSTKGLGAQMAVINAGTVRWIPSPGITNYLLGPGVITKADVDKFLPFDNLSGVAPATAPATVVLVNLTGKQLKNMFENSFSKMQDTGSAGPSGNGRFLQVSHLKIWADVTKPVNSRITRMALAQYDGRWWQPVKDIDPADTVITYRVAVPSKYINSTLDGYQSTIGAGTDVIDSKVYIYDAVVKLISDFSPISWAEVPSCSDPTNKLIITHQ